MRVLIVHKNDFLCRQLAKRLKVHGHDCSYATKYDNAWKALKDKKIDIVLGELTLTNGDGIKLLDRIKGLGVTKPEVILLNSLAQLKKVKTENKNMDAIFCLEEVIKVLKHFDYIRQSKKVA